MPVITYTGLLLSLLPAAIVIAILYRWGTSAGSALYATVRMLAQLLLIGYVLIYIFETDHPAVIAAVLMVMLSVASWIAVRPIEGKSLAVYLRSVAALTVGSVPVLALVTQVVVDVEPWFEPRYVVPLAGMIFSGAMNAVSLAAERQQAELNAGAGSEDARRAALDAALIPTINSLLAVGLVSLPGMMTGQILSGVSPMIAAKYQIMVMTMLFSTTGLSALVFLALHRRSDAP